MQSGTSGEKVINSRVYKDASPTNIDIGYKPRGLKWNGGDAVTGSQLQRITQSRKTSVEHLVHQGMPNLCRKITFWLCN